MVQEILKQVWAENGDLLSKQYTGTGSTITSVTRQGKQGFMRKLTQGMISIERFIKNRISAHFKHDCFKYILNNHPHQMPYGIKASLEKKLKEMSRVFKQTQNITMCILTWNCGGNQPSQTFDISNILMLEDRSIQPDVYIIGLQEMVKLNAKSVLQGKDQARMMLWE